MTYAVYQSVTGRFHMKPLRSLFTAFGLGMILATGTALAQDETAPQTTIDMDQLCLEPAEDLGATADKIMETLPVLANAFHKTLELDRYDVGKHSFISAHNLTTHRKSFLLIDNSTRMGCEVSRQTFRAFKPD